MNRELRDGWGFVADDLTGACIVGGKLANASIPCLVATGAGARGGASLLEGGAAPSFDPPSGVVFGINADSRLLPPREAARRAGDAVASLRRAGARRFFKFVDSGLRGNVGAELEAVVRGASARRTLVVPGTPAVGRTVAGGRLLCFGTPAHRSPLTSGDPLSPLDTDVVVDLFARATALRFESVASARAGDDGAASPGSGLGRFVAAVDRVFADDAVPICDAEDAAAIVRSLDALRRHGRLATIDVLCGSVGLAEAWAQLLAAETPPQPGAAAAPVAPHAAAPQVLVVSGSRSPTSQAQVARLARVGFPAIPALAGTDGGLRELPAIGDDIAASLAARGVAVLVGDVEERDRLVDAAADRRLAFDLVATMARAARAAVDAAQARGTSLALVLVGGMTASAVVLELGIDLLQPVEEHDFVVRSHGRSARHGRLAIVTKGGSAGEIDALARAVELLRGEEAAAAQ